MIATLTVSFGLFCARPRAGNAAANPTVAAAVFDRNRRRFIMAAYFLSNATRPPTTVTSARIVRSRSAGTVRK